MRYGRMAGSAVVLTALVSGAALAHHSYAEFDPCTSVTIEGEIENLMWANPHIVMTVDAGEAGIYRVEWFDLRRLRRAGLSTEVLREGDRVAVTGATHRNPDTKVMTLLSEIRSANSGWHWTRNRERPAAC